MAQTQPESTINPTGQPAPRGNGEHSRGEEARSFQPEAGRDRALTRNEGAAGQALEPLLAATTVMDRWFDEMWGRMTGFPTLRMPRALTAFSGFGAPAADLRETDKAYSLTVELAGFAKDDVELTVRGDQILLSGHKAEDREDGEGAWRLSERRFGRFERSFTIPDDIDREKIAATFKDGVLKITLPKAADARTQGSRIEIR